MENFPELQACFDCVQLRNFRNEKRGGWKVLILEAEVRFYGRRKAIHLCNSGMVHCDTNLSSKSDVRGSNLRSQRKYRERIRDKELLSHTLEVS